MESKEHKELKQLAISILRKQGYEVETEVPFVVSASIMTKKRTKPKERRFRIDVVGIKDGKIIAVECGHANKEKCMLMEYFFDDVYILDWEEKLHMISRNPILV